MTRRIRLGMLTPSSNTALEPLCAAMLATLPDVSCHFARFRVTEISLASNALNQFDDRPMLEAAGLLADARVDAICWNGTSAGWLGFDRDRELCAAIERTTGIVASSSVLALEEIFRDAGVRRLGLVTPYRGDVQRQVMKVFGDEGFACVAERHLDISENFAFADVPAATLENMVREVASARPDAITIFCTNLHGAPLVETLERELGIPVYDTTAAAVWVAMRRAGADPRRVSGWGRLFRDAVRT
jgi:maleate isomerase